MEATKAQVKLISSLLNRVKDCHRMDSRDEYLPAQFSSIGQSLEPDFDICQFVKATITEGKAVC